MRFGIKSLLVLTLVCSLFLVGYLVATQPPVIKVGMDRATVVSMLFDAGSTDIFAPPIQSTYTVRVPYGDPALDKIAAIYYEREDAISLTERNAETYWRTNTGTIETHFKDEILESILRWDGYETHSVDVLALENRR